MTIDELNEAKYYLEKSFPYELARGNVITLIEAEIARQSVTDQDVQRVMYEMEDKTWQSWENGYPIRLSDNDAELIRTALEQMRNKPDCSTAEWNGGKCCGYGKAENDDEPIDVCKVCPKQASYGVE